MSVRGRRCARGRTQRVAKIAGTKITWDVHARPRPETDRSIERGGVPVRTEGLASLVAGRPRNSREDSRTPWSTAWTTPSEGGNAFWPCGDSLEALQIVSGATLQNGPLTISRKGASVGKRKDRLKGWLQYEKVSGLWLAIGIFLFVSYFIPWRYSRYEVVLSWDFFSSRYVEFAVYATYLAIMGVALPIVGYLVGGFARPIVFLSLGGVALIIAVIGSISSPFSAVGILALAAAVAMLVGNNARLHYPKSFFAKLFGGIAAGVFFVGFVITTILAIIFMGRLPVAVSLLGLVPLLLGLAVVVASGVLVMINFGNHDSVVKLARTAQTMALPALFLSLGWPILGVMIGTAIDGAGKETIWIFLYVLRIVGFTTSVLFVLWHGMTRMLGLTVYAHKALRAKASRTKASRKKTSARA